MARCKDCDCCSKTIENKVEFDTKLCIFLCKKCRKKRELKEELK